jgi:serine/threonine protein kinase/WD40 repeat protein
MSANIEQVEALFNRAIEFDPDERAAFLAGACGQDAALLAKVRALLEAHEADVGILPEQPRAEPSVGVVAERPGERIGHYKLLEKIGEGGFGVVYMAEQEKPVRRRVALKIIKLGMDTQKVVARFEAERQALALMDHPNIARVFDAGATQSGRPYFVMELVRGVKITDYCNQNDLSAPQSLDLFVQVCRAIQHAHQKGIIHRDIKPSNVLVTVHDGVPVPKVIDFGIAKATEARLTEQTLFTPFEQFLGTPAYMSPEQAEVKGADVDTRTDIYSLGVLLYELLTGKTPFDVNELLSAGLDEMRRTIREKEPPRPSTRLTMELGQTAPAKRSKQSSAPASNIQGQEPAHNPASAEQLVRMKQLIHLLRGDLDWIVMKCLEKDRTRRYETANGLAMDLQRYLRSEPVVARPPSNVYRLQKLVRRNKLLVAAVTAVALALVLGTVASTLEAFRARRAERAQARLRREADLARADQVDQRAAAEQHLYDALLGEARAKQLSGRAGQRFESLDAVGKAAALHRSRELSDAAVAALALPDLRDQKKLRFTSQWAAGNVIFDGPLELYAFRTLAGISVRRVQDDQEVSFLPVKDMRDIPNRLRLRRFDSRSRYLAAACLRGSRDGRCRVWDLARSGALVLDLPSVSDPDFTPDGNALVSVSPEGIILVQELESGRELKRFRAEGMPDLVRFSPDGARLAGTEVGGSTVRVWELTSGQVTTTLLASNKVNYLAWNHDGTLLATGFLDGSISLWEMPAGRLLSNLEGHEARVTALAFAHAGDLLASEGWDNTLRLWDVARGRQLVLYQCQDTVLHFSADDRTLAAAVEGDTAKLLEVGQSLGYQRLIDRAANPRAWMADFSPDGRLIAVSFNDGIVFWDALAGKKIGMLPTNPCRSVRFQTCGGLGLLGCTDDGLYRWPLRIEVTPSGLFLRVDPPQALVAHQVFRNAALDAGSKVFASRESLEPLLLDLTNPTNTLRLRGHPGAHFVALDPGGHWAATGAWKGSGVKVYDAGTGQTLRELPVKNTAFVSFSPDGHWLATADMTELKFWKTGSWESVPNSLPGDRVSEANPLAFSPDGRLVAALRGNSEIQIVKVPSCEVAATLRVPSLAHVSWLSFSPDGTKLTALEWGGQVDVWDLRIIRQELVKLNLDWDIPPLPAPADAPSGPMGLQLDAGPFSKEALTGLIPARDPHTPVNLIDLTDQYNAPLTQSWHSAKNARNDLSELQPGVRTLGGIEFDVRGLIQLGANAANGLSYPNQVNAIPIHQQCRRLHFLHASIYTRSARPGDELGRYVFHYADGREVQLPLVEGKDLADWWARTDEHDTSYSIAWSGNNRSAQAAGRSIRLFKTTWENPSPDVALRELDFASDKSAPGRPFLVAVTADP